MSTTAAATLRDALIEVIEAHGKDSAVPTLNDVLSALTVTTALYLAAIKDRHTRRLLIRSMDSLRRDAMERWRDIPGPKVQTIVIPARSN